jgi:predicted DNA-binding transcriptional regulator YafY
MNEQLKRSLIILQMIPRYPTSITAIEIKNKLYEDSNIDISIRTIQRDVVTFERVYGIIKHENGWCWGERSKSISIPGLTMMQALTFNLSESYLSTLLPASNLNELKPYFEQANSKITNSSAKFVNWKRKVTIIQQSQQLLKPDVNIEVQKIISTGLLNDNQLLIVYAHSDGEEKEYTINPIGLVLKNGVTYLITEQVDNQYVQIFSLHRIKQAKDLYKNFQRETNFDLKRYIEKEHLYFDNFSFNNRSSRDVYSHNESEITVKLVFTKNAYKHLAETPISEDQVTENIGKDNILVTASTQYTEQLVYWLRGYGTDVEIIEPLFLRERMIEDIEALKEKYYTRSN